MFPEIPREGDYISSTKIRERMEDNSEDVIYDLYYKFTINLLVMLILIIINLYYYFNNNVPTQAIKMCALIIILFNVFLIIFTILNIGLDDIEEDESFAWTLFGIIIPFIFIIIYGIIYVFDRRKQLVSIPVKGGGRR